MRMKPEVHFRKTTVAIAAVTVLSFFPPTSQSITTAAYAAAEAVRVVNGPADPVPVVHGYNLFQRQIVIQMPHNTTSDSETFAVPAGKRLVLENIAGRGAAIGISHVEVVQSPSGFAVLPTFAIGGISWRWMGTTPTKVVFDAGNVTVIIRRTTAQSTCSSCTTGNYITVTGYLVPD
jgi:hypothetical protein